MEIAIGIVAGLLLGAAAGYALGRSGGRSAGLEEGRGRALQEGREAGLEEGREAGLAQARSESEQRMRDLVATLSRGRLPRDARPGTPEADLQRALESGWAPREEERHRALREAVARVSGFLDAAIRAPLAGADASADAEELRERIDHALGALQDVEFFLHEPPAAAEGHDLAQLAQQVTREFAADQGVGIRLRLDGRSARARVHAAALKDALYLVLHNAARFGGQGTIDLTVVLEGGRVVMKVRDRGPGFSEEAFARAFDPFYSTAPEGLGLGLPHARRTVEAMGGTIELRNVPDGGAEVEIAFPSI